MRCSLTHGGMYCHIGLSGFCAITARASTSSDQLTLASIDYVSITDAETLDELDTVKPPALVSLAVRIGKTRLIDNVVL